MAIVKLQAGNTINVTALKNFLDANKTGTFLDSESITISTNIAPTLNQLIITDGTSTFTLRLYHDTTFGFETRTYVTFVTNGNTYSYSSYNQAYAAVAQTQVNEMILCNNGLIIKLRIPYTGSSSTFTYGFVYILITTDSDGGLAVMYERSDTNPTSTTTSTAYNGGFRLYAHNSTGAATATVTTIFNSLKTILSSVQPMVSDVNTTIENVYISTQTQLQTVGLQVVVIGEDHYITNGYWYIKD